MPLRPRQLLVLAAALPALAAVPAPAGAAVVLGAAGGPAGAVLVAGEGRSARLTFALPRTDGRSVRRAVLRVRVVQAPRGSVAVDVPGRRGAVRVARVVRPRRWLALDVTRAVAAAPGRAHLRLTVRGPGRLAVAAPRAPARWTRPRLELTVRRAPAAATPSSVPDPPAPPAPPPAPGPSPAPSSEAPAAPAPTPTPTPAPGAPAPGTLRLAALVEDVRGAAAVRYDARDDGGLPLDTLKVVQVAPRLYAGVYHALVGAAFETYVATSTDLVAWQRQARIDVHASQPTLAALPGGGYVVAYELDGPRGNRLRLRRFPDLGALLAGHHDREATPPRTLSPAAEGTPSVLSATPGGERIEVAFHRFRDADVDRQAAGVLEGWSAWTAWALPDVDARFEALGTAGNLGDRDHLRLADGTQVDLIEAQRARGDWASWRLALHEPATGAVVSLAPRTHGGSTAFGNPTATRVVLPDGTPGLVVTAFVFGEGSAPGEAGALVAVHRLARGDL